MPRTCEICGRETDSVKMGRFFLTQFGNRSQVERLACKNCRKTELKGGL